MQVAFFSFVVYFGNFGQKSKFWTKIEILQKKSKFCKKNHLKKDQNFGLKSKFCTKIEIFDKIEIL